MTDKISDVVFNQQAKELLGILCDMDVPSSRLDLTMQNLKWLARNLALRNQSHLQFDSAMRLAASLQ
ncbi:hypothetical protein H0W80_03590 [Candidatus Saccharibacteria bacterium]|nr:hypothetical protein [Candidatus Saccharibacteria bacterium]